MSRYIALLRGINVGGNNKVEMPKLKQAFEKMGFTDVSTYINTGNVIFKTKKKNTESVIIDIEKSLKKSFGFEIRTIIRDSKNVLKVAKGVPQNWTNDLKQKTEVLFLWDEFANKNTLKSIEINPEVDNLKYIDGAIVWNIKKANYNKSKMKKFIGSKVYKHMTARNINTLKKLAELMK